MADERVLLDTNVLSELMRPAPATQVMAWFDNNPAMQFYTSAITRAEIFTGIALLPEGKRRNQLAQSAERMFAEEFPRHCLAFDDAAAMQYAFVQAQRHAAGRPISTEDGQIAAIALAAGMPLVTRNTRDFQFIGGLELSNPWQAK